MGNSTGSKPRILPFLENEIKTRLVNALVEATEGMSSKTVARRIPYGPDSIDNFRQGNIPEAWVRFCKTSQALPLFGLQALEPMGIDIDQDPQSFAKFLEYQRYINERLK